MQAWLLERIHTFPTRCSSCARLAELNRMSAFLLESSIASYAVCGRLQRKTLTRTEKVLKAGRGKEIMPSLESIHEISVRFAGFMVDMRCRVQ